MAALSRPGRGGLWRHPDFLKLWSAETISQFGSQVTLLALPLVAILVLGASAFEVALLAAVETLPFLLLTLPAGVWVDRLPRRMILIVGDVGRALALISIPVAHLAGVLTMYQLYLVAFTTGVLTVFFDVAYQAYLPSLVERDQIVEGNSKLQVSASGAQIAGPGIAGFLVGAITAPLAILVDALSFLGSAAFVFLIRRSEPPIEQREGAGGRLSRMRAEIGEGLRYVFRHPYLRNIAGSTATSNLFGNIFFAIFLVYAIRELQLRPEVIGLVLAVGNIGFLLGAVVANRVAERIGVGPAIVWSAFLFGPALVIVPLAPRELAVPVLIASGALAGLSTVVYNVNQVSLRQAITPERMQGRMNATMRFIVWGVNPIGAAIGGVLAATIQLVPTLWIGAIGSCFAFLWVLFSPVRSLQRIPEPTETAEAPGDGTAESAAARPA